MKIEGPGKSSNIKNAAKAGVKKTAGDSAFEGMIGGTAAPEEAKTTSGVTAVGQLDALLSLQEAGDSTSEEAVKRSKRRGLAILDQLEKIKMGLLVGELPESELRQLSTMVASQREKIMDPKLVEILDEIDLRAQVELAKFGLL